MLFCLHSELQAGPGKGLTFELVDPVAAVGLGFMCKHDLISFENSIHQIPIIATSCFFSSTTNNHKTRYLDLNPSNSLRCLHHNFDNKNFPMQIDECFFIFNSEMLRRRIRLWRDPHSSSATLIQK